MNIRKVAIIGAGTMGGGIAMCCLTAGLDTIVIDTTNQALTAVRGRVEGHFANAVAKERMNEAEARAACDLLQTSVDLAAVAGADLVIEAVFEDLAIKRALFGEISPHIGDKTIVATNTSALRVNELASAVPDPSRFLGLHYFSPAQINLLVEVVSGELTQPDVLEQAHAFLKSTGKVALDCRDANGFAVNRFFCPYTNEAAYILDDGLATTGQIDAVAQKVFDLPVGPFTVMNIIKPRINLNAIRNLSSLGAFYQPAKSMIETGDAQIVWEIEEAPAPLSDTVEKHIADRLCAGAFVPLLEALAEGVTDADGFDLGAKTALRFGNPPVATMRSMGRTRVEDLIKTLQRPFDNSKVEKGLNIVFA